MKLNRYIDHTVLKATTTVEDIKKLCAEAKEYDFYSVCVNFRNYFLSFSYNLLFVNNNYRYFMI